VLATVQMLSANSVHVFLHEQTDVVLLLQDHSFGHHAQPLTDIGVLTNRDPCHARNAHVQVYVIYVFPVYVIESMILEANALCTVKPCGPRVQMMAVPAGVVAVGEQ